MSLSEQSQSLPGSNEHEPVVLAVASRIRLWFGCLLVVMFGFSLFLGGSRGFPFVFWVAAMFALPVGCFYLPLVAKLKDAGELRWLALIGLGILIGPVALAGLAFVGVLAGHDAHLVWVGDGEDIGFVGLLPCALIVGTLTSALYVGGLKIACRSGANER
jgi:hypothetical protein